MGFKVHEDSTYLVPGSSSVLLLMSRQVYTLFLVPLDPLYASTTHRQATSFMKSDYIALQRERNTTRQLLVLP